MGLCRHGNAASPLTCYSIGIARPSAAVLSQPPQKYEHESRSIAWDRERADASFPMGERSLAGGAISLPRRKDRRILFPSFFFLFLQRHGRKEKCRTRETRSPSLACHHYNTHYRNYHRRNTHSPPRDIYMYIYMYVRVYSRCSLFHPRRNVEFERITETRRWGKSEHNIHPSLLPIRFTRSVLPPRT